METVIVCLEGLLVYVWMRTMATRKAGLAMKKGVEV